MTNEVADVVLEDLKKRIEELNKKASQMLLFLSFAIVGAATVKTTNLPINDMLVRSAMGLWMGAVFPVLLGVAPLKEFAELFEWAPLKKLAESFGWDKKGWYAHLKDKKWWYKRVKMDKGLCHVGSGWLERVGRLAVRKSVARPLSR